MTPRLLPVALCGWCAGLACTPAPDRVEAGPGDGDGGTRGWLVEAQGAGGRLVPSGTGTAVLTFPDQAERDAGIAAVAFDDDGKTRWSRALVSDAPSASFTCATRAGDRSWFGVVSTTTATYDLAPLGTFAVADGDALLVAFDDDGAIVAATTIVGATGCALAGFADGSFVSFTYAAPANSFHGSVVRRHDVDGSVRSTTSIDLTPAVIRANNVAARADGSIVAEAGFTQSFTVTFLDGSTATVAQALGTRDDAFAFALDAGGGVTWALLLTSTDLDGTAAIGDLFVGAASFKDGFLLCGASNDGKLVDVKSGATLADLSSITHSTPIAFAIDANGAVTATHRFDDVTGLVSDCEPDAANAQRVYATITSEDGAGFQIAEIDDDVVHVGVRVFDGIVGETTAIIRSDDNLTISAFVPALSTTTLVTPPATAPGLAGAFVNVVMQAPLDAFIPSAH